jgi:HAE1 family hydrophobic/amphiphilic exporter-1
MSGTDFKELQHWAPQLEARLRDMPDLQDVTTDLQISTPQVTLDIDRDNPQALGVTPQQIENGLCDAYGNRQISTICTPSNEYYVILEALPQDQRDPLALSKLYITSSGSTSPSNPTSATAASTDSSSPSTSVAAAPAGRLIPLDEVAKLSRTVVPLSVNHTGQLPSVTVSFNLKPGASLGAGRGCN